MRKLIIYFISTLFILFAQPKKMSIAVLDFEALMIQDKEVKALTNRIRSELVKTGTYQVVEREKMDEILKEQGFQLSGCTSAACVVEAGQLLGVEKMLAGSVSKIGEIYSVELRLIDVESGKIEKSDSYDMEGDIGKLLLSGMKNALYILLGIAQPQNQITSVSNAKKPLEPQNTTFTSSITGTVTDIDGNLYKTIKIGSQWWMAENLKVTHYRNGDPIPNVTDYTAWENLTTGALCDYNSDLNNVIIYGKLYNWHAISDGHNIAPNGWHVPTNKEWKTLVNTLGGESIAGDKMKESGIVNWSNPNTNTTNEIGFAALPGGYRFYLYGTFHGMGSTAYFWSSTMFGDNLAWYLSLKSDNSEIGYAGTYKNNGLSIRCVKD